MTAHTADVTKCQCRADVTQARQANRGSMTSVQKRPLEHCLRSPKVNALQPAFTLIYT